MSVKHVLMIATVLLAMFVVPVAAADTQSVTIGAQTSAVYTMQIPESLNFVDVRAGSTITDWVNVTVEKLDPNCGVFVSVTTEHNWNLTHVSPNDAKIQYNMTVAGTEIENGGKVVLTSNSLDQQVIFTLEQTPTMSGTYEDRLTFTADMKTLGSELVSSEADLKSKLDSGQNVILKDDLNVEPTSYGAYTAPFHVSGEVFDGNGKTLNVAPSTLKTPDTMTSDDTYAVITISEGTIKNLKIDQGQRAIVLKEMTGDVYIDNVELGGDYVTYCINTGSNLDTSHNLIVTNSKINGWTSFANINSATFKNCDFGQGTFHNDEIGRTLRPYVDTVLENCHFIEDFSFNLYELLPGETVTLKGCTVGNSNTPISEATFDDATLTFTLPEGADPATPITEYIVFE